ncbi:hypothetical protein BH10PSE2_BH10PSE2_27990 [soil metagenome]
MEAAQKHDTIAPPPGFELALGHDLGFNAAIGPLYVGVIHGEAVLGFRVTEQHVNPMGFCHGAALAALSDMQMTLVRPQIGLPDQAVPTITLSIDFLAPAPLGSWVEIRTELVRQTRGMIFTQAMLSADGDPVARTNAIYKVGAVGTRGGADLGDLPPLCLL